MRSSNPARIVAIVFGTLAVLAIPVAVVAALFVPSVDVLPALVVAVPSAFVLALFGLSAARRARYRIDRSVYRSGERTVRFGRFLVWSGLYLSVIGALALALLLRASLVRVARGSAIMRSCSRSGTASGRRARGARSTSARPSRRPRSARATCARSRTSASTSSPSQTYVKGFLRTYADYLGLDGQLYVDEFNSRFATGDDHDARTPPLVGAARAADSAPRDDHRPDRGRPRGDRDARRHERLADVRLGLEGAEGDASRAGAQEDGDPSPAAWLPADRGGHRPVVRDGSPRDRDRAAALPGDDLEGRDGAVQGQDFWVSVSSPENLRITVARQADRGRRLQAGLVRREPKRRPRSLGAPLTELRAAIVVTGSELVRGDRTDLNGPFLARSLLELGIDPAELRIVGDVAASSPRRCAPGSSTTCSSPPAASGRRTTTSPSSCSRGPQGFRSVSTRSWRRRSRPVRAPSRSG